MNTLFEVKEPIDHFDGVNHFLSNFYPVRIEFEGIHFESVEQAFVAAKSLDMNWRKTLLPMTPGQAKRAGRKIELRPDWDNIRNDIMYQLVKQKFTTNNKLRELLLSTQGRDLIEGNNWGDRYWGTVDGVGENHLGKILMRVRSELAAGVLEDSQNLGE